MQSKVVLIAGATGFVGRALVTNLLNSGFSVKILSRNTSLAEQLFPNKVEIYEWPKNQLTPPELDALQCNVLINLAGANIGAKRWTAAHKRKLLSSRIESVIEIENLVQAMNIKPELWIQASAVGFYGQTGEQIANEATGKGTGFLADLVYKWEQQFRSVSVKGMRKLTLRLGIVMGKHGGFFKQMLSTVKFGLVVCPGNGKQHLPWIEIDDLCNIILHSIKNDNIQGVINCVSPNNTTIAKFFYELKKLKGALWLINLPAYIFILFLGKGRAKELILSSQRINPDYLQNENFVFKTRTIEQFFVDRSK